MNNSPLITVIVPVYNVEPYLDRCVQSIVDQSYTNLEIILVDDGSPDNCPAMCDAWAARDSRIKVIHKENGGLSDARNAGLAAETGKYIAFVDSDDWVEKGFLSQLYRGVKTTGAELAACEVRSVADGETVPPVCGEEAVITKHTPEEAIGGLTNGVGFRAVAWNKLYKAELLQGESFAVGKLHEDEFFSYRIFDKCCALAFVHLPLYNYLQREGSIMSSRSMGRLDVLEAYSQRLELLRTKYPSLYLRDRIVFCTTCVNLYCDALWGCFEDSEAAKSIIKRYRSMIRFRAAELLRCAPKKLAYIIGSAPIMMDAFAKVRIKRKH